VHTIAFTSFLHICFDPAFFGIVYSNTSSKHKKPNILELRDLANRQTSSASGPVSLQNLDSSRIYSFGLWIKAKLRFRRNQQNDSRQSHHHTSYDE
jgi:hypothetical protein